MKREDAEKHIGKLVITSFIGGTRYIGELLEVIPSKPFRAIVKIRGVYKYPELYCHNKNGAFLDHYLSKGSDLVKKENDIVETGNGIELYHCNLISYNHSLINAIEDYLVSTKRKLDEFENNSCFGTAWINNKRDCLKLYDILFERMNRAKSETL